MDDINNIYDYNEESTKSNMNCCGFGFKFNCKYKNKQGRIMFETIIEAASENAAKVKFRDYRGGISERGYKAVLTRL